MPVTGGGNECTIVGVENPCHKEGTFLVIGINAVGASLGWGLLEFE